jgi:manganese transport protein
VTVIPLTSAVGLLLIFITLHPWLRKNIKQLDWSRIGGVHHETVQEPILLRQPVPYKRMAIALDFSGRDEKLLAESLRFIDKAQTQVTLLHVVESPVARTLGAEGEDLETLTDRQHIEKLTEMMQKAGIKTDWQLGTGDPVSALSAMINELNIEMVVVGSHGHTGVSDLIHGTVISNLRHHIKASVIIIPLSI